MALEVHDLSFDYPLTAYANPRQLLLQHISWRVPQGGILHIRGANGSGKTTLVHLLAGLLRPDVGYISYGGVDINAQRVRYQQDLAYIGHKNGISLALSPLENTHYDLQAPIEAHELTSLLQQLSLMAVKDLPCHRLSAGQKRRVALLRLFRSRAKLWLLDEPLVALDTAGLALFMTRLKTHLAAGGMVVYTSHQPLPWVVDNHQDVSL